MQSSKTSADETSDSFTRLQELVTSTFQSHLKLNSDSLPLAVPAIEALIAVVESSKAKTFTELQNEVSIAIKLLDKQTPSTMIIPLNSICNQFKMFVFRRHEDTSHTKIQELKNAVVDRGRSFVSRAKKSREYISDKARFFIQDGSTILCHSKSSVVLTVLKNAIQNGKRFNVIISETQPNKAGYDAANSMKNYGIPVKVILDSSVAVIMDKIDFVLVGAEGVTESGGIINRIGTYQIAIIAKAMNRPFYVVAESHKFNRMFPLTQNDIPWKEKKTRIKSFNDVYYIKNNDIDIDNDNDNENNNNNNYNHHIISKEDEKKNIDDNNIQINGNTNNKDNSNNNNVNEKNNSFPNNLEIDTNLDINNFDEDESSYNINQNEKISNSNLMRVETDRVRDYTPPEYITLLFTDLGVLTPSAVSDELIKLYQ